MENFESSRTAEELDRRPLIEETKEGKRFTIRIRRKPAYGRNVKSSERIRQQLREQVELGIKNPSYKFDIFDYRRLLPCIGSPENIEMGSPKLKIALIRHLRHQDNVVVEEDLEGAKPRLNNLLDDLKITDRSKVYLIASLTGQMVSTKTDFEFHSRTEGTAGAIAQLLEERGIEYQLNNIDDSERGFGSTTSRVRDGLREFEEDTMVYEDAIRKFKANQEAGQSGQELPYPDPAHGMHPAVFASFAKNLKELREKAGVGEMSSASVARGLNVIDAMEGYFLGQGELFKDVDKVVVIMVGHGQFGTGMSEAMHVATEGNFPIFFANNGAYWRMDVGQDKQGEVVEELIMESGDRTGMELIF